MPTCSERIKRRKNEKQGREARIYLANRNDGIKEEEGRKEGRGNHTPKLNTFFRHKNITHIMIITLFL